MKVRNQPAMEIINRRMMLNNGDTLNYAYGRVWRESPRQKLFALGGAEPGYRTYIVPFPGSTIQLPKANSINTLLWLTMNS